MMNHYFVRSLKLFIIFLIFYISNETILFAKEELVDKTVYLTNLNNINISQNTVKDLTSLKELIKNKKPKALYIEQWILVDPGNENLLKKLYKLTKKNDIKLFLVIGKNTWFGRRGTENSIEAYKLYGEYIDGIVLRTEPNKVNLWKNHDDEFRVQILNFMLDGYADTFREAKKRNKKFIVEFPFWFSDFIGLSRTFSQEACDYSDNIVFLIDDAEKLETLEKWNDITCPYSIDLTKRATSKNEKQIQEAYNKLKSKVTFYSNFSGFIIDSDSALLLQ